MKLSEAAEVLEVSVDASEAVIKAAYRKLALKWHPDKNTVSPEMSASKSRVVHERDVVVHEVSWELCYLRTR